MLQKSPSAVCISMQRAATIIPDQLVHGATVDQSVWQLQAATCSWTISSMITTPD